MINVPGSCKKKWSEGGSRCSHCKTSCRGFFDALFTCLFLNELLKYVHLYCVQHWMKLSICFWSSPVESI